MALIQAYVVAAARSAQVTIEYLYPGWPALFLAPLTGGATTNQNDPYPLLDEVTVLEILSADAYGGGRGPENRVARMGEQRTNTLRGYTNTLVRLANLLTENFIDRDGVQNTGTTYMRGDLNMNGFKLTGMAAATDSGDLVTFSQFKDVQFDYEDRRDFADQATLSRSSGVAMGGNLDMGVTLPGQRVVSLAAPSLAAHMVTKTYTDTAVAAFTAGWLPRTGTTTMTNSAAAWDMGQNGITGMADPTAASHAVNKGYFDTASTAQLGNAVPIGMVMPHFGATIPTGWLVCDGREVSRVTYTQLFASIGIAYGLPSSGTTFVLPDLRGRAIVGLDNMGGVLANRISDSWARSLGGVGGGETHALTTAQMPSHTHTFSDKYFSYDNGGALIGHNSHNSQSITFASVASTTDSVGNGNGHNNVQPSMAIVWIIRAG